MANSMALAFIVGATPEEAFEISKHNQGLVIAESPLFKVPAFGYKGAPIGLDMRKVKLFKPLIL